jgi:hypothetical protein
MAIWICWGEEDEIGKNAKGRRHSERLSRESSSVRKAMQTGKNGLNDKGRMTDSESLEEGRGLPISERRIEAPL